MSTQHVVGHMQSLAFFQMARLAGFQIQTSACVQLVLQKLAYSPLRLRVFCLDGYILRRDLFCD